MNNKMFFLYLRLFKAGNFLGCHQRADRSFFVGNWQYPVCARCTGLFLGQAVMVVGLVLGVRIPVYIDVLLLVIMFVDWFVQFMGWWQSNNVRRLVTGFFAGGALTSLYFTCIMFGINLIR